jgi:hypothetical protein
LGFGVFAENRKTNENEAKRKTGKQETGKPKTKKSTEPRALSKSQTHPHPPTCRLNFFFSSPFLGVSLKGHLALKQRRRKSNGPTYFLVFLRFLFLESTFMVFLSSSCRERAKKTR